MNKSPDHLKGYNAGVKDTVESVKKIISIPKGYERIKIKKETEQQKVWNEGRV